MMVPLSSPDNHDLTAWAVQCDHCYLLQSVDVVGDWLLTEEEVDRHYCPACTDVIAQRLVDSATPRRRNPLGLAVAALIAVGVLVKAVAR